MAAFIVDASDDPGSALRRSQRYLAGRPVDHNLVLSLLQERLAHPIPGRYWTVRGDGNGGDGEVVGFALQSPRTYCATVTPMARPAAEALAGAIALEADTCLPGVIGDAATAAVFAGRWSEVMPDRVTAQEGQRLYRLGRLQPVTGVPGRLRRATDGDRELLVTWWAAMAAETNTSGHSDPAISVQRDLAEGRLFVWDDWGPASMVRASIPVAGVCRIGMVFSPPHLRGRGYASAGVGAICSWVQQHEPAECILYTQLANPTSNGIYRRLGFTAVAELLRYQFERRRGG
jgi:uncharacterized protein